MKVMKVMKVMKMIVGSLAIAGVTAAVVLMPARGQNRGVAGLDFSNAARYGEVAIATISSFERAARCASC